MAKSPTFDAARELLHLMISRATDAPKIDARAYKAARDTVMSDATASRVVPECVRICRSPDEVWTYVKAQAGLDTYHSRREFFRGEFEPMLSALERFDTAPLDELVAGDANRLGSVSVIAGWRKALDRRTTDPEGAITAARTLLESVCLTILDDLGAGHEQGDDLPKLYRAVSKALRLAPSDHTEQQFKRILGGATSVVEGLGSLRNRQGDAHGQGRKSYKPSERHAALAVNLAGSMAAFLMQTWEEVAPESIRHPSVGSTPDLAGSGGRSLDLNDDRTVRLRVANFMSNSPGVVPVASISGGVAADAGEVLRSLALLESLGFVRRVGSGWARV